MPNNMPIATNPKMLYAACYLYDCIKDKENLSQEFVNEMEWIIFNHVMIHINDNLSTLKSSHQERIEIGKIVVEKIYDALCNDINEYAKI